MSSLRSPETHARGSRAAAMQRGFCLQTCGFGDSMLHFYLSLQTEDLLRSGAASSAFRHNSCGRCLMGRQRAVARRFHGQPTPWINLIPRNDCEDSFPKRILRRGHDPLGLADVPRQSQSGPEVVTSLNPNLSPVSTAHSADSVTQHIDHVFTVSRSWHCHWPFMNGALPVDGHRS
eukprot:6200855-Pleurochrysis_carterae.AAC.1